MAIFISKQLKYFMVAMEQKSITKAAETLCLTRTPLSKILSDLEKFLGKTLFDRQYNTLIPTQFAWDLYHDLLPIYEAHQKLENKIKASGNCKDIKLIFDVSFPEILYRIVIAIFHSDNEKYSVICEKQLISDQYLELQKNKDNVIIISFRKLSPVVHYNHISWESSELTLVTPNRTEGKPSSVKIFLWKDMFSCFFEKKIVEKLGETYTQIEFIKHNYDLSTLIYKIYQGEGSMLLTHKVANIYKTDYFTLVPIKNHRIKVNIYHNLDEKVMPALKAIKKTLLQLL